MDSKIERLYETRVDHKFQGRALIGNYTRTDLIPLLASDA